MTNPAPKTKVKRITPYAKKLAARRAKISKLRAEGYTLEAIGDKVGLTAGRISQILIEDGKAK